MDITIKADSAKKLHPARGSYGVLQNYKGKNLVFKFISVRPSKGGVSMSLAVQDELGNCDEHDWKMIRTKVVDGTMLSLTDYQTAMMSAII